MASRRRCGTRPDAGRSGTAAPTGAKQNGREMGSIGRTDAAATEETSAMDPGVGEALRGLPQPMWHPARCRAARDGRPYGHDREALRPRHGSHRPPLDTRGRQNQSKVLIHRSGRVHTAVEHGSSTAVVRPVPSGRPVIARAPHEGLQTKQSRACKTECSARRLGPAGLPRPFGPRSGGSGGRSSVVALFSFRRRPPSAVSFQSVVGRRLGPSAIDLPPAAPHPSTPPIEP